MNLTIFLLFIFIINSQIYSIAHYSQRPDSAPLLSGDTFLKFADHVLESTNPIEHFHKMKFRNFDISKVKENDIIFVSTCALGKFFEYYHPNINCNYILISHNHDLPAPGVFEKFLNDSKIKYWFCQNPSTTHPKLIPIPIGLSNKHWAHSSQHDQIILNEAKDLPSERKILLYVNFNARTNPAVRNPIHNLFYKQLRHESYITCAENLQYNQYIKDVKNSKFIISPPGNGLDCHRTWEALYLGCIPIVATSYLDKLFEDLPVLIIKDWQEINQEFLESKYAEISSKIYNLNKLYFNYWKNLILQCKGD